MRNETGELKATTQSLLLLWYKLYHIIKRIFGELFTCNILCWIRRVNLNVPRNFWDVSLYSCLDSTQNSVKVDRLQRNLLHNPRFTCFFQTFPGKGVIIFNWHSLFTSSAMGVASFPPDFKSHLLGLGKREPDYSGCRWCHNALKIFDWMWMMRQCMDRRKQT